MPIRVVSRRNSFVEWIRNITKKSDIIKWLILPAKL